MIVANNPANWLACKNILVNRFSDPSSEDPLFNKLSTCYQKLNQNFQKYADDVKYNLSKVKEHIQLNNQDATIIDMKNRFYENVAKNTFVNGIKEPYHYFLTHFGIVDNEARLTKCHIYDNHKKQASFLSLMRQRENNTKLNLISIFCTFKRYNHF